MNDVLTAPRNVSARLPAWAEPFLRPAPYKSVSGGRGSTKSHTFAQIAVLRMGGYLPDYEPAPVRIASARQFQTSIVESVKQAVESYIRAYRLSEEFDVQSYQINHRVTGSHMWFPGFDRHPESLMSTEGIDVLWIEQAETLGNEMEKIIPTIRKAGREIWLSWNPSSRAQWCWQRFGIPGNREPTDLHVHTTWRDNPFWHPWCTACTKQFSFEAKPEVCDECGGEVDPGLWELEMERRRMEEREPDRYLHVYGGEPDDGDASKQVLTYGMVNDCVKAYRAGLAPSHADAPLCDYGLDIGEGGADLCAQVIRVGPTIEFVDAWPGVAGDLSKAAERAHANTGIEEWNVLRAYYDASAPMRREFNALSVPYAIRPEFFGGEVKGKEVLYEMRQPNDLVFARRNIQMADALRLRANRSVRLLRGDKTIDPATCLFIRPDIPNLEGFLTDLTQPIRRRNPTRGKWELDKRGGDENAESPDKFDGACLAFARDSENGLKAR